MMALIFFALFQVDYCEGENMSKTLTNDEFVDRLKSKNVNFIPIDPYKNAITKIRFQCLENPEHIWEATPTNVLKGTGCPICFKENIGKPKSVDESLWGTNPEVASLLKDTSIGYEYKSGYAHKAIFVCPYCGKEKLMRITDVTHCGIGCSHCHSTTNSFPNMVMSEILKQAGIDYEPEFIRDWTDGRRYDFYFVINNKHYFVEMDGGFHYTDYYNTGIFENDQRKNKIAEDHNIELIRIDCNYKHVSERFDYIINNILNSKLSSLIDFGKIDLRLVFINADTPFVYVVAKKWNDGNMSPRGILSEMPKGVSLSRVRTMLKHASELGLIPQSLDEVQEIIKAEGYKVASAINSERQRNANGKILCVETGEVYPTYEEAQKATGVPIASIGRCINGKQQTAGKLPDGTRLTWRRISNEEYLRLKSA